MLSVIIPSYKDPLLWKTIDDIFNKAEGEIEIVVTFDGYWPTKFNDDPRIVYIHTKNNGMREAINRAVSVARGEYLMRTDEHCIFGQGFDRIITSEMEDNWIVVPRHYSLDSVKWEVMGHVTDYNRLKIDETYPKFSGFRWPERNEERRKFLIDETMAMQGSVWFMPKKHWDTVIKDLDSAYGTHYQDSTEMIFKTWQAGGKMMVNKKTWFAHRHRDFNRTHNYPRELAQQSFDYALKVWRPYYEQEIKPRWQI